MLRDSGLRTPDSGLVRWDSGLVRWDSGLVRWDSELTGYDPELAFRLQALVSAHTRRANHYLLINMGSAMALAGAGGLALAALAGPELVFRRPIVYALWALGLGLAFWSLRHRWWTDTSMGYYIDRVMDCDNLLRSAWLGLQRREPSAFLELNVRRACDVAEAFVLSPPWPLAAWDTLRRWTKRRKKSLLSVLFYLILLLLLALWLYTLLTGTRSARSERDASAGSAQDARPSPSGRERAGSERAGDAGRTGSPSAATNPADHSASSGSSGSKPSATGAPSDKSTGSDAGPTQAGNRESKGQGTSAEGGRPASGDKSQSAGSTGATAGTDRGASPGTAARPDAGAAGTSDPRAGAAASGDRPGHTSGVHRAAGQAPEMRPDKRLIVMPGIEGTGMDGSRPSPARISKTLRPAGKPMEAEEVRPPGRVPREYERFLKNP